jgi:hypothetical protein
MDQRIGVTARGVQFQNYFSRCKQRSGEANLPCGVTRLHQKITGRKQR